MEKTDKTSSANIETRAKSSFFCVSCVGRLAGRTRPFPLRARVRRGLRRAKKRRKEIGGVRRSLVTTRRFDVMGFFSRPRGEGDRLPRRGARRRRALERVQQGARIVDRVAMAARTTPRAAALVAARLLRGAATADARHVPRPSCGRVTRAARPFASDSARGARVARHRALPAGSALRAHPLMRQRTGRYSIDDFALVVDEVRLGDGMPTAKIVRPESEDAVLDMYVELGLLDHDPYWAALWPSSVALARGVAERARGEGGDLRGKSVCDMGAGLGLAGIAAALCGAESVAFYDREPLALQCCLLSAEANGLRVAFEDARGVFAGDQDDAVEDDAVSQREGGERKKTETCVVSASVFDWNAVPVDQERFDLVLACDVLYETHAVKPVASLVPKLTKEKTGVWLVADPPLRAPKNRARFVELIAARDFSPSPPRETTTTHNGSTDTVLLLEFKAK